ncbi:MAG TPA: transporter [Cyanobacteria bacterium UBA11149]|nr:transporter [Cyanobacteria bacterium UBA11367]HBE60832.1 transporter [Cyanobacteria bacterium UBA11366]HBK66806.1 transporter [Cyanobacteria bacterium UBA11166]HBR74200.1 transporter [Cyanobacteria bacterium UBA11159]HBS70440.1 transporter [Cyanobacteria bacterium UBA11153]HBW91812.1 transporter [Cyanobacteria bacterium UBA11149]HCA94161.1 transporter [Cyanobacteria bacterium UBA9226]
MPNLRYFLAVGVGSAIALFQIKPSVSQDISSLIKPNRQLAISGRSLLEDRQLSSASNKTGKVPLSASSLGNTSRNILTSEIAEADSVTIPQFILSQAETDLLVPVPSLPNPNNSETPTIEFINPNTNPALQQDSTPGNSDLELFESSPNPLLFPTQTEEVQIENTQPLTLKQAIELAERNNQQLQAARLTLERNQLALQETLASEFPTISAITQFIRNDSAQSELANRQRAFGNTQDNTSTTIDTSLQLNYNAYTAGRRPASIRAAEEQVRFQQLEVEKISEDLRLSITRAYYDLQDADAQVEIRQAAVNDAARSLRDAQLLEQAGLGTRFEVLQAQVELQNNNQDLTNALRQQRINRRQIAQILSLSQKLEISAADPIQMAGEWELSLEDSIILALKNRSELEQQLVQRNISEQQERIALAANKPQLSVFANYDILGQLDDNDGVADGLSLGARFQWDFFDGGAAKAKAKQAVTNIAIAETNFAAQRNQVRFEVEQAFFNLRANKENIQTANLALEQAQESLRLARLRFQAGVGTQTDVINQQTALTRSRVNLLTAILNYNRALADLQRAISNLPDSQLFDLP